MNTYQFNNAVKLFFENVKPCVHCRDSARLSFAKTYENIFEIAVDCNNKKCPDSRFAKRVSVRLSADDFYDAAVMATELAKLKVKWNDGGL